MKTLLIGLLLALTAGAEEAADGPPVVPLFEGELDGDGFPEWGVGPLDPRDPFPLALLHFTIPVHDPSTLPGRTFSASFDTTWANTNAISSEFVVDAEVIASRLSLAYGITDRLQVTLEVPFTYVGAGQMDHTIERFHSSIGAGDHQRDERPQDAHKIRIESNEGPTSVDRGAGIGDLALGVELRLLDGRKYVPALSLSGWVKAPTATTNAIGGEGWDGGVSLQFSKRIGPIVIFGGGSFWSTSDPELGNLRFEKYAKTTWGGLELGLADWLVLVGHTSIRTHLIRGQGAISRTQYYIVVGLRAHTELKGLRIEGWLGVLENYSNLKSTADFGLNAGVKLIF